MNSWTNQNQNQNNTTVGQAQFSPYWGIQQPSLTGNYNTTGGYGMRAPVYHAEPIHGENAAWAFPIGGGEIWLPDADQDLIWWIKIDQNGNKQVKSFDVKPHEEPQPVDMNNILARLGALEEWVNGKQNKSNAKRSAAVSTNAAGTTTATVE